MGGRGLNLSSHLLRVFPAKWTDTPVMEGLMGPAGMAWLASSQDWRSTGQSRRESEAQRGQPPAMCLWPSQPSRSIVTMGTPSVCKALGRREMDGCSTWLSLSYPWVFHITFDRFITHVCTRRCLKMGWVLTVTLPTVCHKLHNKSPFSAFTMPLYLGYRHCWEPWATIWQGCCALAAFQQGRNLQVHHVSIMTGRNAKWFPLTEKKFILSQGHWQ
jgi:hypothetical protein